MRGTRTHRRGGRCPLGLRPHPREIWAKMKGGETQPFIFAANIPAGGSDRNQTRTVAEPGAQNSSFKKFGGQGARA